MFFMGDNMNKLTNDQNIKNLKQRKILRYWIIIFGIVTIILSILSLVIKLNFVFPLITFVIMTLLTNKRNKIPINLHKDLELKRVKKALENQKKKK